MVLACYGVELATLYVAFYTALVKKRSNHVYAVLVTDKDDFVGKVLRTDMQVECRTVAVDNQL